MGLFHDLIARGLTVEQIAAAIDAMGQLPVSVSGTLTSETDGRGGTTIADNPPRHFSADVRIGIVTDKGPNGEGDYGDAKYWVLSLVGTKGGGNTDIKFGHDGSIPDNYVTALHIPEALAGTHTLEPGSLVLLLRQMDIDHGKDLYFCVGLPTELVKIKITSVISGAGAFYNAKLVKFPAADIDKTADATTGELGAEGDDCIAVNLTEIGRDHHSHLIANGTEWLARRLRHNTGGVDGTGDKSLIVEFNGGPASGELFKVNLVFNAGADGAAPATPATWAYDVTAASNGEQLATNATVERPRLLAGQTNKATMGTAYYGGANLILAEAWETFGETQCPGGSSSSSSA